MSTFFSKSRDFISHYLLKNSFPRKLTFAFLGAIILPLILISLIFYKISSDDSYEKVSRLTYQTNQQIVEQIESRFTQIEKAADTIQSYMYSYPKQGRYFSTEQVNAFSTLRTNISSLVSTFDFLSTCVFLDDSYIFTSEGLMFYPLDRLEDFQIDAETLVNEDADSIWLYIEDQTYPVMLKLPNKDQPVDTINCVRLLQNSSDHSLYYLFFISIRADEFSELWDSAFANTEISGYLIDKNQKMITSSGSEEMEQEILTMLNEQINTSPENLTFSDKNNLYYINILSNGWYYITDVPQTYIRSNSIFYLRIFLLILILIIPFAIITVVLLTRNLTKRITLLSESASQVSFDQNQFHPVPVDYITTKPEKDFDEVDQLAFTYNELMAKLEENIEKTTELRAQEESLKYQLLQSMIDPHFLYNILDSIIACNTIGNTDLANKLLRDLTRFYRLTLHKSSEMITIRDELEIATLYMEMESICYGGTFTWDIEKDEGVDDFLICKFTLQPFIENSILHGMPGNNKKLHIKIEIRFLGEDILINIRDNGKGISPEKLGNLRDSLKSHQIDTSKHFGICNVNARISGDLYGHGFIEIDSELNKGTVVRIEFQQQLS